MKKLNIAILSIHSCPVGQLGTKDNGGMSVYIRETASVLGRLGHRVDIFTRYHDPDHPEEMILSPNVRLIHLIAGDPEDLSKLSVYPHVKDYAMELEAFREKNHITYDVIHSHYWLSGLVGRILSSWWKKPHMIMFHTLGEIKNNLKVGKPEPDFRICNEKALAKFCHRIVAPTPTEKKYIVEGYAADENKVCEIPCGVNQDLFKPVDKNSARQKIGLGENENIILYVGRVEPLKGLEQVIHAIARLNDKMPVKLLVVGGDEHDAEEMQEILGLVRRLKLEDAVCFSGRVEQKDLPVYYSAADVLVVASVYESFGLVALEALSCGTPVVSTPVGGMKTFIQQGKTGFLLPDHSIDAMASALNQIFSNSVDFENRSLEIRESVKDFSWSRVGKSLLTEYLFLTGSADLSVPRISPPVQLPDLQVSCG